MTVNGVYAKAKAQKAIWEWATAHQMVRLSLVAEYLSTFVQSKSAGDAKAAVVARDQALLDAYTGEPEWEEPPHTADEDLPF